MTDNSFARTSLCNNTIPPRFFFLIQEIRHLAASLSNRFNFIVHWIPSHVREYTFDRYNIPGSDIADTLANIAREKSFENQNIDDTQEFDIEIIRDKIMTESAKLTWKISGILKKFSPFPSDSPSSDDFSSANANQIISVGDDL